MYEDNYQKYVASIDRVYLESGRLLVDFEYRKCRSGEAGEVMYGDSRFEKGVLIADRVERYKIVPPNQETSFLKKMKSAFRGEPCKVVVEAEDGWREISITDRYATRAIFESKGISEAWVVEHPIVY